MINEDMDKAEESEGPSVPKWVLVNVSKVEFYGSRVQ